MTERTWGHCKDCRYFASPARRPLEDEEARCSHPELTRYNLKVFGASGCSGYELRLGIPEAIEHLVSPP